MKNKSLVGRAFGMVLNSKKVIDKLTSKGFECIEEKNGKTTLIKRKDKIDE